MFIYPLQSPGERTIALASLLNTPKQKRKANGAETLVTYRHSTPLDGVSEELFLIRQV